MMMMMMIVVVVVVVVVVMSTFVNDTKIHPTKGASVMGGVSARDAQ